MFSGMPGFRKEKKYQEGVKLWKYTTKWWVEKQFHDLFSSAYFEGREKKQWGAVNIG